MLERLDQMDEQSKYYRRFALFTIASTVIYGGCVLTGANPHWWYGTYWGRTSLESRLNALRRRVEQGPRPDDALDELIILASASHSVVRSHACAHLGALGSQGARGETALLAALNSGDGFVEKQAAIALGKITKSPRAVAALIDKVRPYGGSASHFAVDSLGEMGPAAVAAVPKLREFENSTDDILAHGAKRALARIAPN